MKKTTKVKLLITWHAISGLSKHLWDGIKYGAIYFISQLQFAYYIDKDYTLTKFGSYKEKNVEYKWVKN